MIRFFGRILLVAALCGVCAEAKAEESTLRIVSYNVWYGFTKKPEPRYSTWRTWMASQKPDVVSLQELNGYTEEKLAADAKAWGHEHSLLLKRDGFPTGFTSNKPITEIKRIREGMHHGLLRCKSHGIYFYVIHFHPSDHEHRIREARILQKDVKSLPEKNPRVVLVGDFNGFSPHDKNHYDKDTVLEPFFKRLDAKWKQKNLNAEGKLDYRGLEEIAKYQNVDLVQKFRTDFVGTFPTELRREEDHGSDRRLDYVFVSSNLLSSAKSAKIIRDNTTAMISDHYPVIAEFSLSGEQ